MDPLGHVIFAIALAGAVGWKLGARGTLLLVLATLSPDALFIFGSSPHLFLHSIAGFSLLTAFWALVGWKLLDSLWRSSLIAFSGVGLHILADVIESMFPQTVITVGSYSATASFLASLVSVVMLGLILLLRESTEPR